MVMLHAHHDILRRMKSSFIKDSAEVKSHCPSRSLEGLHKNAWHVALKNVFCRAMDTDRVIPSQRHTRMGGKNFILLGVDRNIE